MRFLVSYDLIKPGKDYKQLIEAIRSMNGKQVLLSQWVVTRNGSALDLAKVLWGYMDTNDRLFVVAIPAGTDLAWGNPMTDPNTL